MVTTASPFFACLQLRRQAMLWRFEKLFVLQKVSTCRFSTLKLHFPSSPRLAVELHAVLVLVSGLSWKWTVYTHLIPAAIQMTTWFRSLTFDLDLDKSRCYARNHTLCGLDASYTLFLIITLWGDFWQFFQSHGLWICFSWSVMQILSTK